jgi:tRNA(Arg) A34 adenosine deaminase TadA
MLYYFNILLVYSFVTKDGFVDKYMQVAIEEAKAARAAGDDPYGSVLVRNGEVIGIETKPRAYTQ